MSTKYDELRDVIEGIGPDVVKFYEKGNKAAGTRVRKAMQEVKRLAQEIRQEVQSRKSAD